MDHAKRAKELFMQGYNCAQAVFAAFADVTGMDESLALRLASSMGAGIGRMREVCGAISGMAMAAGILYGYDVPDDDNIKQQHYERVRLMAEKFKEKRGTVICRELLNTTDFSPVPSKRTAQYYAERPCAELVYEAVKILDEYIADNPISAE